MSGSDRYLSMSLDDIIKLQRKQKSRGSNASQRGQRGQKRGYQSNQRGQQWNNQQQRGYNNRRQQQQQQGGRRGFRGNQRQGLRGRGNHQSQRGQIRQQQPRQWQGRQQPRQQQARGGGMRAWSSNVSLINRQNFQSRQQQRGYIARQAPVTRGGKNVRGMKRLPQRNLQQVRQVPRGPQQLSATQLARNRVRLAAQILVQRKQQLQHLQTFDLRQGGRLGLRGGLAQRRAAAQLRKNVMNTARSPASFSVRGARRGALINRLNARTTVANKMARVQRNRQNLNQSRQMLSVNIENERALPPAFEMPELVVINDLPRDTPTPPLHIVPRARIAPRQPNRLRVKPSYALQPELHVEATYTTPGTSRPSPITLHERFASFTH